MLWRTHIRIVNEILRKLGFSLSSPEANRLRDGVIIPDRWRDFPHHHGKSEPIKEHVVKARMLFLDGNLPEACFHLGVALHYIQDSYTSLSTRSRHHTRWEEQVDQAHFTDNLKELVNRTFPDYDDRREDYMRIAGWLGEENEGKISTLELATASGPGLSFWGPREWGKPYIDVNFALKASYVISKSVFSEKHCPKLDEELQIALKEYEEKAGGVEIRFANEIMDFVKRRDDSEKRKGEPGTFRVVRNLFLTFLNMIHNFQVKRKLEEYREQKHLKEVLKEYRDRIDRVVMPHRFWYVYCIPEIQLGVADRELLSLEEVSESLQIEKTTVRDLIARDRIFCYRIQDEEFISKSELAQHLSK